MNIKSKGILRPGENCWRTSSADRVAFLVDGADYYRAFFESVSQARHSVFILGWDIDSRLKLLRDTDNPPYPVQLVDFLNSVAAKNKQLHIYVLVWDFAAIYTLEREWWPAYKFDWKTHRRVHFCLHNQHPPAASFHQKTVVVDNKIAFVGGIDLSKWRWDTSTHRPDDANRIDPDGKPYPPFHDMQMLVGGKTAADLGELARDHWRCATGKKLRPRNEEPQTDPWPRTIQPDIEHTVVAIARTIPEDKDQKEVREIERLYLDAIRSAKKYIYIENQYLSAHKIGAVLAERLQESEGPEVVIVLPYQTGGWLEQNTMDVLRCRLLKELRKADRYDRLRTYYPHIPELGNQYIGVHSKLLIIDDTLLRIGSSNLSNRSMGLDIECDLAIESQGQPHVARAITAFRDRLLAEHLDVTPEKIRDAVKTKNTLIGGIESLRGSGRSLEILSGKVPDDVDGLVPQSALLDPEAPIDSERLTDEFICREDRKPAGHGLILKAGIFVLLLLLAAAWRWSPLGDWLDLETLLATLEQAKDSAFTPLWVIAGFMVGGFMVIPVTLMIVTTILVFGALKGFFYALTGAVLSAVSVYGLGHFVGRDTIQRFQGSRLSQISRHLARQGILTVIATRMLPVAPFSVINIVAGVSRIRFRDFAIGTLIGMTPGILAYAILVDHLKAAVRDPSLGRFALISGVLAVLAISALLLRAWLLKLNDKQHKKKT